MTLRADINRELLRWARRTAGFSVEEAARKILGKRGKPKTIVAWEEGNAQPTVRQLFRISDVYRRPVGAFYLSEFPRDFTIPRDFRRLPGEVAGRYSPKLLAELRHTIERREAALELFETLGVGVAPFVLRANLQDDPDSVAGIIRDALHVSFDDQFSWQDRSGYLPLNAWRQRIEALDVFVFQSLDVDLSEMLGFSIAESKLPIIGVNRKSKPNGRIFTMLHEFVHLMLRLSSICDLDEDQPRPPEEQAVEIFCNRVAGAALVPAAALSKEPEVIRHGRRSNNWTDPEIEFLALKYGVSREVIVRRLLILQFTTDNFYQRKRAEYQQQLAMTLRTRKPRKGGESGAARAVSSLGAGFLKLVMEGQQQGALTLTEAAGMIGERVKWLPKIQKKLELL